MPNYYTYGIGQPHVPVEEDGAIGIYSRNSLDQVNGLVGPDGPTVFTPVFNAGSGYFRFSSGAEARANAKQREAYETIAYPAAYFDPDAADDTGDGSIQDPYRDVTAARLLPGRRHLIKAGTTIAVADGATSTWITTTTTGTATAPIIIGRYGEGVNPKVDCAGAQRGIRFGTNAKYFRVRDLEIYGCNAGSDRYGISVNSVGAEAEQNTTRALVIERCHVHDINTDAATDCNGMKLYGADNEVLDCTINNVGADGIWFHGYRTLIQGCTIYSVALDNRDAGDCIQCGAKSDGSIVRGNFLDHRNKDYKQCVYFEPTISVSDSVLIEDNTCHGFDGTAGTHTTIFCGATNSTVRRNYVTGGALGIQINSGGVAHHNVVIATVGNGISPTGARVYYNTIVQTGTQNTQALSCGVRAGTAAAYGSHAINNVIIGFYNSILAVTGDDGFATILESGNTFATQGVSEAHYRVNGIVTAPSITSQIVAYSGVLTSLNLDVNYRPLGTGLSAALSVSLDTSVDKDQLIPQDASFPRGAYIGAI